MDKELKAKWIAALRSGKFKQGHAQLKNGDKFCCLGILCVVAKRPIESNETPNYEWMDTLDIPTTELWKQNDSVGKWKGVVRSFPQIADWIEQNL